MTAIGIEGMTTMIEGIVDNEPTVMRLFLPFADVYMVAWEEVVMLFHETLHSLTYTIGINNGIRPLTEASTYWILYSITY